MNAYGAILSAQFRTLLQYRAAAVAGIVTQIFFGLVIVMVYEAFYASTTEVMPISLREVIIYTWLGMIPWNVDPDIRAQIRNGGVAYEMLRPVDLYSVVRPQYRPPLSADSSESHPHVRHRRPVSRTRSAAVAGGRSGMGRRDSLRAAVVVCDRHLHGGHTHVDDIGRGRHVHGRHTCHVLFGTVRAAPSHARLAQVAG